MARYPQASRARSKPDAAPISTTYVDTVEASAEPGDPHLTHAGVVGQVIGAAVYGVRALAASSNVAATTTRTVRPSGFTCVTVRYPMLRTATAPGPGKNVSQ
jgi:hypothetical protein